MIAAVGYDCDGDLENTADSIFCAHGAGYAVKWDEVEQHMHLPSCLTAQPEEVDVPETPVRSAGAAYHGSLAEDKELMAIFERTYGRSSAVPGRRCIRRRKSRRSITESLTRRMTARSICWWTGTTSSSPGTS